MRERTFRVVLALAVVAAVVLAIVHCRPTPVVFGALIAPGAVSPAHADLGPQCESCHEPTVGVTAAKCIVCHATSQWLLERQPTAFHASIDECAACHLEHGLASLRPATMDHAELARIGARTLDRAAVADPASAATRRALATWLRTGELGRMDETAARQALDCAGCHDRHDPHFGRFGSDCAQCHVLTTWSVPAYRHPSPRSRDCVQCHQAPPSHFMGHFSMVSRRVAGKEHAQVDECFECHETTGWNDIVGVGFYKHH